MVSSSSLLKNGDWLRPDTELPRKKRSPEVPVPLFQRAAMAIIVAVFLALSVGAQKTRRLPDFGPPPDELKSDRVREDKNLILRWSQGLMWRGRTAKLRKTGAKQVLERAEDGGGGGCLLAGG